MAESSSGFGIEWSVGPHVGGLSHLEGSKTITVSPSQLNEMFPGWQGGQTFTNGRPNDSFVVIDDNIFARQRIDGTYTVYNNSSGGFFHAGVTTGAGIGGSLVFKHFNGLPENYSGPFVTVGGQFFVGASVSWVPGQDSWIPVSYSILLGPQAKLQWGGNYSEYEKIYGNQPECFLEDTMIDMWDGSKKPIQDIAPDDLVVSYDKDGKLVPGKVNRTFQNHAKHILDVHGLMMTPGHVTYCGEGKFAEKHVPVIDILRSDGALMNKEGNLIRAATGFPVGSEEDRIIPAVITEFIGDGTYARILENGTVRLGTTFMARDGRTITVKEIISKAGLSIREDGYVEGEGVETHAFVWTFGKSLPKPEDYVLQRSAVTIEEIYTANEWENVAPQMPTPYQGEAGRSFVKKPNVMHASEQEDISPPNIPLSMRGNKNQPTMSRKQRRAHEAKERKGKKATASVH